LTASGTIAAPIINTAGYVSSTEGTKNTNSIAGSKALNKIGIGVNASDSIITPVISRTAKPAADTWVDAASGAVTTTKPTSGAYVLVSSAANTTSVTCSPTVTSEGYGTSTQFDGASATINAGANASAATYVPIKTGTITSGTATITSTSIAYNSSTGKYNITGSADVSAPTFTEGYIASNVGTKNSNSDGAQLNGTLNKIAI